MKGRDITTTKGWPALQAAGFRPVRFKCQMGFLEIGAALQADFGPTLDGSIVKVDRVTIEPSHYFTNAKGKRVGHWTVYAKGDSGLTWCEGRTVAREALAAAARIATRQSL